jgi:serine beta-lactamase-like protein LACTB, mitochondrial
VEGGRQIVRAALGEQNLPGVSVAVAIDGGIVWAEGFGWADIGKKTPVTPRTRFRIGTASIPFTSTAAGLLMEKGALNLDEKIQAYVPEFPEKQWPVTLRQLMAHTAGIRSDSGDEGPLFGEQCDRPVDALPFFAESDLLFEPGTAYRYSRFGWIVVSAAIEQASGTPFLAFMQKQVFEPLGMDDTMPDSAEPDPDRATSYFPRFAADPRYGPDLMRDLNLSCYAGSSVFVSTASDIARFALGFNNGTLLQRETVQLLQSSQKLPSGEETGYGLGWDLEHVSLSGQPALAVGHDGDALGGIVGSLMMFEDRGLVVAVISNTSYADTPALALKIAEAFTASR